MYELTCPSCRKTQKSPFVRVSAVTRCPSCSHAWRISESHFTRRAIRSAASAAVTPEPELKEDPPPAHDPMGGSSVTGLSGLSDIMQAEPARLSAAMAGRGPAPLQQARLASAGNPPASAAPRRPDPKLTHLPRRTVLLIVAALAAFVALAGIALAVMSSGGDELGTAGERDGREVADPAPEEEADLLPQGPPRPEEALDDE